MPSRLVVSKRVSWVKPVVSWPPQAPPPPPPEEDLRTAVHIVQSFHLDPNNALFAPTVNGIPFNAHDIYICNHGIRMSGTPNPFPPLANPTGIYAFQSAPTLIYRFGTSDPVYQGIRDAINALPDPEIHFWHTALPATEANRLLHSFVEGVPTSGSWFAKPSANLGVLIGNVILANFKPEFHALLFDECQQKVPDHYWNPWDGAADGPGSPGVDPSRAYWDTQWQACILAAMATVKNGAGWGTERGLFANTAGGLYQFNCDAIMIEAGHYALNATPIVDPLGEIWAQTQFMAQRAYWLASALKYGTYTSNMAIDYPQQIENVVQRCYVLPTP